MLTEKITPRTLCLVLGTFCACCVPAIAHAQDDAATPAPLADALSVKPVKKAPHVPSALSAQVAQFALELRHFDKNWPRLLGEYVQPALRGMIAARAGHRGFALNTNLFKNERRGTELTALWGRNDAGYQEATLRFGLHF